MIIEEDSSCVDDDSLLGSEKNQRGARIELYARLCNGVTEQAKVQFSRSIIHSMLPISKSSILLSNRHSLRVFDFASSPIC